MEKAVKEKSEKYIEAIGRRKESIARVRITRASSNKFIINNRDIESYFPTGALRYVINEPVSRLKLANKYIISVRVSGGGVNSQAEATRLGLSRALIKDDKELKFGLKKFGYLTVDSRAVERKKFGKKKARKKAQWSKR